MGEQQVPAAEDPQHQQIEWRLERVGWVLWTLVLATAAAGLLGKGMLSSANGAAPDASLRLRYYRVLRKDAVSRIRLQLSPGCVQRGEARLRISHDFLEWAELDLSQPAPLRAADAGTDAVLVFAAEAAGLPVTLRFQPETLGVHTAAFGCEGAAPACITLLVLP